MNAIRVADPRGWLQPWNQPVWKLEYQVLDRGLALEVIFLEAGTTPREAWSRGQDVDGPQPSFLEDAYEEPWKL